jgi:hypothetical protein
MSGEAFSHATVLAKAVDSVNSSCIKDYQGRSLVFSIDPATVK